jgi:hypothetical protein
VTTLHPDQASTLPHNLTLSNQDSHTMLKPPYVYDFNVVFLLKYASTQINFKIFLILYKYKICFTTLSVYRNIHNVQRGKVNILKLLIIKRYYVLFLIPVFIVQVTKLLQFLLRLEWLLWALASLQFPHLIYSQSAGLLE